MPHCLYVCVFVCLYEWRVRVTVSGVCPGTKLWNAKSREMEFEQNAICNGRRSHSHSHRVTALYRRKRFGISVFCLNHFISFHLKHMSYVYAGVCVSFLSK